MQKKKNRSIIQANNEYCYVCGKPNPTDEHHIFGGGNRNKSDEDGMIIYLHRSCHRWLHDHPISANTYKIRGQKIWELKKGSRDDFIKRYGKSYILED